MLFQVLKKQCDNCGSGSWQSIDEGELAVLLNEGDRLTDKINQNGSAGYISWVADIERRIEVSNGCLETPNGPVNIRRV